MGAENEKATKNRCFRARNSYGEERGLARKWLPAIFNRRFRRPGRLWAQNKAGRAREGGLSGIHANFVFEIWTNLGDFGHKKGEICPQNGQIPPERARKGVEIAQIGPNFKIAQI